MKKGTKIIIGVFAGIMVLGAVAGLGKDEDKNTTKPSVKVEDKKDSKDKKEDTKAEEKKEIEVIEATAAEVLNTFDENEAKGNKLYKGKRIKLTGKIAGVDYTDMLKEEYVLSIDKGEEFELVNVRIGADMKFENELIELKKDEDITVIIDCKGYVSGLYVDAELVEIVK